MDKITALTICSFNYISKALVLIDSYIYNHPNHQFTLLIVDKKREFDSLNNLSINILWVEDLLLEDFHKYAFMFDIIEFNTNVKPMAIKYLLRTNDIVIYLDPDIQVFSKIDSIIGELSSASILITPHTITPILDGCKPDDSDLLRFGAYNLGFIAVTKCTETFSFLDWWSERCLKLGFYEPQLGLAVDQKWIDLAPAFFPNLKISFNIGLNVAFWNLHERHLSKKGDMWFVNDIYPLVFFHFSSFSASNLEEIAYKQTRFKRGDRSDFIKLANEYNVSLKKFDFPEFRNQNYAFDFFDDGVIITPIARRIYSIMYDDLFSHINPFDSNSSFRKFAIKNRLIEVDKSKDHKRQTFKDLAQYRKHEKVILYCLKLLLLIIGPNRYYSLMRYLPYISSIRNQKGIVSK
jgi:hypothetical protein